MRSIAVCLTLSIVLSFAQAGSPVADERVLDSLTKPVLKLKNKEPELVDGAQYRPASKEYKITRGQVVITHKISEVDYCIAPKPRGLAKMKDIESLKKVIRDYDHLWWDQRAAQSLIVLYNGEEKYADAIALYRKMRDRAGTTTAANRLRQSYWAALDGAKRYDVLERELHEAAAGADRQLSAHAYVALGDMLAARGETKRALAEGYLKTVAMFDDIVDAKYKALKAAIALMEKVGDHRVDRLHKMLKADFGHVEEAR